MPGPFTGRTERSITTRGKVSALGGLYSRGMPVLPFLGKVVHVSSTHANASDNNDGENSNRPMATIDAAINKLSANNGDAVLVHENHAETIATAGAIAADLAGIAIIGLGHGSSRPKITISTLNTASIAISAASVTLANIIVIGNKDGLTQPIHVTGNDCVIDIEYRDTSATVEAVAVVLADTVSRLDLTLKYVGFTTGDAAARPVNLTAVTGARIEIDAYGVTSVAWVNLTTTLSTDIFVTGKTYTQGVTNGSRNVVDTITGSKWFMDVYDASAGARYSGGSAAAVASDDISAANSSIVSTGVLVSTGNSSTVSLGVANSTAHSSDLSATVSAGVLVSTGNSSTVSLGVADSTGMSSGLSATVSYGVAGSAANSSGLSATVSAGVLVSTGNSSTVSLGVANSTAHSSDLSATVSAGVLVSTGNSSTVSLGVANSTGLSSGLSATVSYGVAGSTANSSGLSATVSYGVAGSAANSSGLSATVSVGTLVSAIGKTVGKGGAAADTGIPNNVQAAGGLLATATGGDVFIEEVVLSKDGTLLTGPTSIELSCNNVYGPNGADDILGSNVVGGLGAQDTVRMTAATVAMKPFTLESTKAIYIHGSDAAGTSAGNYRFSIIGRALTAGATLV